MLTAAKYPTAITQTHPHVYLQKTRDKPWRTSDSAQLSNQ